MNYTLTHAVLDGDNKRYPLQKQEIMAALLEQHVYRSVYLGKFKKAIHNAVNSFLSCWLVWITWCVLESLTGRNMKPIKPASRMAVAQAYK